MKANVFSVRESIEHFGVWYAVWMYGAGNLWTIFVATRMINKRKAAA